MKGTQIRWEPPEQLPDPSHHRYWRCHNFPNWCIVRIIGAERKPPYLYRLYRDGKPTGKEIRGGVIWVKNWAAYHIRHAEHFNEEK